MNSETEIWIVLSGLCLMVGLLSKDRLRPGLVLFSVVVLFMCTGILTPEEVLAGFGNKGVITVALLFLVSEGVRRSDALGHLVGRLLPEKRSMNVRQGYVRILPAIASVSAFLNNTPVVVVFIPIIKQWARRTGLPLRKFLIPLSYAAILGSMCTLIGTSTNLVIQGMMLEAGFEGFTMFELGKVGVFIVLAGTLYMIFFAAKRLPGESFSNGEEYPARKEESRIVEAVLGPRFPGINRTFREFDFRTHYGAEIREIRRGGVTLSDPESHSFREGDTLVLDTDGSFIRTWGDSSVFLMLSNGKEYTPPVSALEKVAGTGAAHANDRGCHVQQSAFRATAAPRHSVGHVFLGSSRDGADGRLRHLPGQEIHEIHLMGHPRDHRVGAGHQPGDE